MIDSNNVVDNNVFWDGNTETWTPPANHTWVIDAETPAMVWSAVVVDEKVTDYVLEEVIGAGDIGFTWNGTVLTTNQPEPQAPVPAKNQPTTSGVTTI